MIEDLGRDDLRQHGLFGLVANGTPSNQDMPPEEQMRLQEAGHLVPDRFELRSD